MTSHDADRHKLLSEIVRYQRVRVAYHHERVLSLLGFIAEGEQELREIEKRQAATAAEVVTVTQTVERPYSVEVVIGPPVEPHQELLVVHAEQERMEQAAREKQQQGG